MKAVKAVVLFVALSLAVSGQSKVGTSIGQFLLIEPSARVAGMGNAGVTTYGEIQAAYYNPASVGYLKRNGVQFTHILWLAGIAYNHAAVSVGLGRFGNLLATVTSLNSGKIEVRTVEQPLGTGELYTVQDLAIGIGFGRQISDRFSIGVQLNYVQETIWRSSMSAFGLNVGTLYKVSDQGLHLGASLSNFGTRGRFAGTDLRIQFDRDPTMYGDNSALPASQFTEDFPLPILFRVGLSYPVRFSESNEVRVAVDAFHPSDNAESISVGAEWAFANTLFFRSGYQNLFLKDSEAGLTLGGGLRHTLGSYDVSVDYAWADYGRLKETHRFTFGVSF